MLYMEFIQKVKELVLEQFDNGLWYLQPEWRYILHTNGLSILKFRDFRPDWYTVEENLKLEVEKRNASQSKMPDVLKWVDETISQTFDPAMLADETELVESALKFRQMSHAQQKDDVVLTKEQGDD